MKKDETTVNASAMSAYSDRDELTIRKAVLLNANYWDMEVTEPGDNTKKVLNPDGTVKRRQGVSIVGIWTANMRSRDKDPDSNRWGLGTFNFTLPGEKFEQAFLFPAVYECYCEMADVADKDNRGQKTGKSHTEIRPVDIKCVGLIAGLNTERVSDEQLLYDYSAF